MSIGWCSLSTLLPSPYASMRASRCRTRRAPPTWPPMWHDRTRTHHQQGRTTNQTIHTAIPPAQALEGCPRSQAQRCCSACSRPPSAQSRSIRRGAGMRHCRRRQVPTTPGVGGEQGRRRRWRWQKRTGRWCTPNRQVHIRRALKGPWVQATLHADQLLEPEGHVRFCSDIDWTPTTATKNVEHVFVYERVPPNCKRLPFLLDLFNTKGRPARRAPKPHATQPRGITNRSVCVWSSVSRACRVGARSR